MALTRGDFSTPAWLRFKEDAQERLDELRLMNDAPGPEAVTIATRAKIAELKYWLGLDEPPPTTSDHS